MIDAKEARIRTFQNIADEDYLLFKHVEKLVVTAVVKGDFGISVMYSKELWYGEKGKFGIAVNNEVIEKLTLDNLDRQKIVMCNMLRELGYSVIMFDSDTSTHYINW